MKINLANFFECCDKHLKDKFLNRRNKWIFLVVPTANFLLKPLMKRLLQIVKVKMLAEKKDQLQSLSKEETSNLGLLLTGTN